MAAAQLRRLSSTTGSNGRTRQVCDLALDILGNGSRKKENPLICATLAQDDMFRACAGDVIYRHIFAQIGELLVGTTLLLDELVCEFRVLCDKLHYLMECSMEHWTDRLTERPMECPNARAHASVRVCMRACKCTCAGTRVHAHVRAGARARAGGHACARTRAWAGDQRAGVSGSCFE